MKKILIFSTLAFILVACGNSKKNDTEVQSSATQMSVGNQPVPDMHTSRDALDYGGTYAGTIPCADCSGIDVVITLDYQGNYTKKMTYQGKEPNNVFTSKGTYSWEKDGGTISLMAETEPDIYFVGENQIIMLDQNGQRITGDLAEHYVLKQVEKIYDKVD